MTTGEYKVRLEAFEGPLDLLLHLVRKAEVDIEAIPLASIADQYINYLAGIDRIDIELAGEFLVMAATLLELKSRLLQPPDEASVAASWEEDDPAEALTDPGSELVRKLLEYKKTRDAADDLEERADAWSRRGQIGAITADRDSLRDAAERRLGDLDLDDIGLYDLVEAFAQIIAQVDMSRLGDHHIVLDDDTSVEEHAASILSLLRTTSPSELGRRVVPFRRVFEGRGRGALIGLFLAVLELVRDQHVGVAQDEATGEITLELKAPSPPRSERDEAADVKAPVRVEVKPIGPAATPRDHAL
jgi:segregation and condensation protein A